MSSEIIRDTIRVGITTMEDVVITIVSSLVMDHVVKEEPRGDVDLQNIICTFNSLDDQEKKLARTLLRLKKQFKEPSRTYGDFMNKLAEIDNPGSEFHSVEKAIRKLDDYYYLEDIIQAVDFDSLTITIYEIDRVDLAALFGEIIKGINTLPDNEKRLALELLQVKCHEKRMDRLFPGRGRPLNDTEFMEDLAFSRNKRVYYRKEECNFRKFIDAIRDIDTSRVWRAIAN
jgi:hypothetical protein